MDFKSFKEEFQLWREVDKRPREGCSNELFSYWKCCPFHRYLLSRDEVFVQEAIVWTNRLFPGSIQDRDVPQMFWINGEFMAVLSELWWELAEAAYAKQ